MIKQEKIIDNSNTYEDGQELDSAKCNIVGQTHDLHSVEKEMPP